MMPPALGNIKAPSLARANAEVAARPAMVTVCGGKPSKRVWAARCRALCQHTDTTASISPTVVLGDRELEVAMLAARGLSNRDIANELFLSPKTVENTLGKVFRKLGARSRTQLTILVLSAAP